ncbi:NUDIX hydrolase [Halococcus sp. IIIV-5B]|uniref:NUDIX hydrolase n=1 Tax=Halococcus sp. IIIV-5B TaxID=2321230 RepID=UPI000E750912|nr:NUDIX domain-containing protein [Halococcus sp. IIIV-5B]RJT04722.1 NUDIX domain-containing protein [Halococcus sp. IIIV-5B]
METTRHFTTKVYIVNEGATALHEHPGLGLHLPPGGHVDRDELPAEAALREVREETGLNAELLCETADIEVPGGRPLAEPAYYLLYDVDVDSNGEVAHQHIDHIYFGRVSSREIVPTGHEAPAKAWNWYMPNELRRSDFDPDTVQIGLEAIEAVE